MIKYWRRATGGGVTALNKLDWKNNDTLR